MVPAGWESWLENHACAGGKTVAQRCAAQLLTQTIFDLLQHSQPPIDVKKAPRTSENLAAYTQRDAAHISKLVLAPQVAGQTSLP